MTTVRFNALTCILLLAVVSPVGVPAGRQDAGRKTYTPAFVEVRFDSPVTFSRLKPGDTLPGEATRNVYSGYRLVFPAGSRITLKVAGMEKQRKEFSDTWPWPAQHFRNKYERLPTFDLLTVSLPGGGNISFPVSMVIAPDRIHVAAQPVNAGKSKDKPPSPSPGNMRNGAGVRPPGSSLELVIKANPTRTGEERAKAAIDSPTSVGSLQGIGTLSPGAETKLALLGKLSASKSRPGDSFKAILAEPLRLNSGEILPEGSLFEGSVRKSRGPRWLSRPGSLYLTFNRLVLPTGASLPVAASVVGIEADPHSRMRVDSEGGLSGGSPGTKRLLVALGVGFGFAKLADDSFQLIAEALVSTATDASTAGTARLIGMAVGGVIFIKRRGRDVVLPPYTMIDVRFDRSPLTLTPEPPQHGME
jgi:hypothetical protein